MKCRKGWIDEDDCGVTCTAKATRNGYCDEHQPMPTDTERLDWLDRPWVKVAKFPHFDWMSDRSDVHPDRRHLCSPLTLREAIDAAMSREADDAAR